MNYTDYIAKKSGVRATLGGIDPDALPLGLHDALFPFQREAVARALRMGRAALFLDTGLGKTVCQCEWARHIATEVYRQHGREARILFVAPLAVASQTVSEAKNRLEMDIRFSRDGSVDSPFTITNYEMVEEFEAIQFDAVVLDESSILKNFTGKTKRTLCEQFAGTRYRLAATATPAPNDLMEIGNHAEFLGVMRSTEMLSRWFINDAANVGKYRLKGHAKNDFWRWVASWAVCAGKPSDLGEFDDSTYKLPKLHEEVVLVDDPMESDVETGELFDAGTANVSNLNKIKRRTIDERVAKIAEEVNASDDFYLIWCETNEESRALSNAIPDAVEVTGSMTVESKRRALESFSNREARVLVSKSSICGFGMNWQHCRNVIFASVDFSFEKYYQAVRRSWRFGQSREVCVQVYLSRQESNVWSAICRKARSNREMKRMMAAFVAESNEASESTAFHSRKIELPAWMSAA